MVSGLKQSSVVKLSPTSHASFSAFRANRNNYDGLFNPIIGFDDFRLSTDVFGPHQHKHMSALSYLFDDSAPYHNQDSMGKDLTISPGSLLWTWAGSGVTHHEFPEQPGANIHGLQLFLEIPTATRNLPPKSIYIPVGNMPVEDLGGLRIKVVMGMTGDLVNRTKTPEDITFLDIAIGEGKNFQHQLPPGWNGTIYLLSGELEVITPGGASVLTASDTLAIGSSHILTPVYFKARKPCHLLFISGHPVE